MARAARIEIYLAENGEHSWHLIAPNGAVISSPAETFDSRRNAIKNIRRVQAAFDAEYLRVEGPDGRPA